MILNGMHLLITGSNGLLGQKLVELLARQPGLRVHACGQGENRLKLPAGVGYSALDIRDSERGDSCCGHDPCGRLRARARHLRCH